MTKLWKKFAALLLTFFFFNRNYLLSLDFELNGRVLKIWNLNSFCCCLGMWGPLGGWIGFETLRGLAAEVQTPKSYKVIKLKRVQNWMGGIWNCCRIWWERSMGRLVWRTEAMAILSKHSTTKGRVLSAICVLIFLSFSYELRLFIYISSIKKYK